MKKIIGILVCILLILALVPMSISADDQGRKTITVDDNGGADYLTIQEAIDNADAGDTVFVYSGTYLENVIIDVSIDLLGEDKETTIVDGSGVEDVIFVAAEGVTISGFKIQRSGNIWYHDGGIHIESDNCYITSNNFIYNPENGILIKSSYNTISENYFSNTGHGITVFHNHGNIITDNVVNGAGAIGIYTAFTSDNNIICNNVVYDGIIGIQISEGLGNEIYYNYLYDNQHGIFLHTCSDTLVYENIVENNYAAGIDANYGCHDNYIFHNNIINNEHSAFDFNEVNIWDQGYPMAGNYWSDYEGEDLDGDGIGDTPYNLGWKQSIDYYPLMEPFGTFRINTGGPYFSFVETPVQFNGFAISGIPPYEWFWDFGDDVTSDEQYPVHIYAETGEFKVTLTVTDDEGFTEKLSTYTWIQDGNTEPNNALILGPSIVKEKFSYEYTFIATDPDKSSIYYYINWDDGDKEEWLGPFDSGEPVTVRHTWWEDGNYFIKVKVKDVYGKESGWKIKEINVRPVSRGRLPTDGLFLRFLERFPNAFQLIREVLIN